MSNKLLIDGAWRWRILAGQAVLVNENATQVVIATDTGFPMMIRDAGLNKMRPIEPADDIAKVIAAAPMVRRHALNLISGIDLGLVRIETDADETLGNVLGDLRRALRGSE